MPQAQPSAQNARQNPNLYGTRKSTVSTSKMDKSQRTQSLESLKHNNPLRRK